MNADKRGSEKAKNSLLIDIDDTAAASSQSIRKGDTLPANDHLNN